MKPIVINNLEDLGAAVEAKRQAEKRLNFGRMYSGRPVPLLRKHAAMATTNAVVQAKHAATYGLDFGAMEDLRAFVKVQDGFIEAVPDNLEAHKKAMRETPPDEFNDYEYGRLWSR